MTATQNRPGPTLVSTSRSESRAKAKSTRMSRAKGTTWLTPTRDRASTRRSLPATRAASRHMDRLRASEVGSRGRPAEQAVADLAAGDDDRPGGEGVGPLQLVGRQQDGGAGGRRLPHQLVEEVAAGGVEAGVGLVEQPQVGLAGERPRPGPPAAAGRPTAWPR